jgi:hypothetical protein
LLFLQIPLSSESVLDHIAEYVKFISDAQSFWFTLNTSYDARAGGWSEVLAEVMANATVEVMAEATAEATAEVTEGGGVTIVDATIIQTRGARWAQWEAVVRWEVEAKADGRRRHDKRQCNNQPDKRRETLTPLILRGVWLRRWCAERRRRRRTGGDGITRGDATTSQIRGVRGVQCEATVRRETEVAAWQVVTQQPAVQEVAVAVVAVVAVAVEVAVAVKVAVMVARMKAAVMAKARARAVVGSGSDSDSGSGEGSGGVGGYEGAVCWEAEA